MKIKCLLVAAPLLWGASAQAACTGVGLFTCGATVSVALPLAFGNYNPSSSTSSTTDISVTATVTGIGILVDVSYTIGLSAGSGGSIAARVLNGPGTPLAYNLYTTNAYTTVWGASSRSDSFSLLASVGGTSLTRSYTVYGRIPAAQYVTAGSYSNTNTATVTY